MKSKGITIEQVEYEGTMNDSQESLRAKGSLRSWDSFLDHGWIKLLHDNFEVGFDIFKYYMHFFMQ